MADRVTNERGSCRRRRCRYVLLTRLERILCIIFFTRRIRGLNLVFSDTFAFEHGTIYA